jgi:hypothetical protein
MNRDIAAPAHTWCLDQNRAAITVTLREDANSISDILIVQKNPLRLIHTYHAVPLPCRCAKHLDCLSHLIYTVRPCLIHTYHAVPLPYHEYAVLKATSQGYGTVLHGNGMGTAWYL